LPPTFTLPAYDEEFISVTKEFKKDVFELIAFYKHHRQIQNIV